MSRGIHPSHALALAIVLVTGAMALAGCGTLLGIDDGLPDVDGDVGDALAGQDVVTSEGGSGGQDAGDDGDADADAGCSDPTYCNTHCGKGVDTCGASQTCTDNCHGSGDYCDAGSNTCSCDALQGFCDNKCGAWTDNCGNQVTCNGCDGGGCTDAGLCASCTPNGQTCGTKQCGFVNNGCTQLPCGSSNGNCPNNGECDAGACCTPLAPSVACAGKCDTTVSDGCWGSIACAGTSYCGGGQICNPQNDTCCTMPANPCGTQCTGYVIACGQMVSCGTTGCGVGQECNPMSGHCCTPTGCGPPGYNNCYQPDPSCAPDSGPEGGTCGTSGEICDGEAGSCCPGLYCENNGTCGAAACSAGGAPCMGTSQCCAGLQCSNGLAAPPPPPPATRSSRSKKNRKGPFAGGPDAGSPDAGIPGTCMP